MPRSLLTRFYYQRHTAMRRGIDWELTYDQWLKIWKASGHLHERGRLKGQYVMARIADQGPYSRTNVEIITHQQNVSESYLYRKPYRKTKSHRAALSKAAKRYWSRRIDQSSTST